MEPTPPRPPRPAGGPRHLTRALVEIEQHVAAGGWDQPPRLFALVPTADLLHAQPQIAGALGAVTPAELGEHLTPVEQEDLPESSSLEELLAMIAWPPEVVGTAVVVERLMLPPEAERDLAPDGSSGPDALLRAAGHPERQDVRLAAAVLRDGSRECAVRMRSADRDEDVLSGAELVPGLVRALEATLQD